METKTVRVENSDRFLAVPAVCEFLELAEYNVVPTHIGQVIEYTYYSIGRDNIARNTHRTTRKVVTQNDIDGFNARMKRDTA